MDDIKFPAYSSFHAYSKSHFSQIRQLKTLSRGMRFAMRVVATVLPFRVNQYVIDQLIDWNNVPDDPIFQMTFPQPGMLSREHFDDVSALLKSDADNKTIMNTVHRIHMELNPHPAEQMTLNVPMLNGEPLHGIQHKYRETVLFFPTQGQTCHAYCTFCFRWPQFAKEKGLRICLKEGPNLHAYLKEHKEVSDLLVTGGDPMVMKSSTLSRYLLPLRSPDFDHIQTIRIGTKALTYWPHRFVFDADADELLFTLEKLVKSGKHVAIMAHYNHWREMETEVAREAIRQVRNTGVVIRAQGPLLAHINDDKDVWATMWRKQVHLGITPYYMFVERDTGAYRYFEVPLARAWEIYQGAIQQVSGLGRTVRGPSMSASPGKVEIQGVAEVKGEKVFVLRFLQGRNPDWAERPFFAKFDAHATWLNHLKPAFGEERFFFEEEFEAMRSRRKTRL